MRAERMKVAVMHRASPLSSAFDENTDSTAPTDMRFRPADVSPAVSNTQRRGALGS